MSIVSWDWNILSWKIVNHLNNYIIKYKNIAVFDCQSTSIIVSEKLHNLSKINLVFTISQLIAIESHVSYFIFLGISEMYTAILWPGKLNQAVDSVSEGLDALRDKFLAEMEGEQIKFEKDLKAWGMA